MKLILCIESSTDICSVALFSDKELLCTTMSSGLYTHSEELTVLVDCCLQTAKINIGSLNAVALSRGPGSFTALRVGASVAKAICYSLKIPLIAVDTLQLLAVPYANYNEKEGIIISTIDARRDEVYAGVFTQNLKKQVEFDTYILNESSFLEYANQPVILCGNAAEKAKVLIKNPSFIYSGSKPAAEFMGTLAVEKVSKKIFEDIAYFVPLYMKLPNITKPRKSRL